MHSGTARKRVSTPSPSNHQRAAGSSPGEGAGSAERTSSEEPMPFTRTRAAADDGMQIMINFHGRDLGSAPRKSPGEAQRAGKRTLGWRLHVSRKICCQALSNSSIHLNFECLRVAQKYVMEALTLPSRMFPTHCYMHQPFKILY